MVQSHLISVPLAVKYGSNESLFLSNLCWWMEKNRANKKHFHDGRYWTYNTVSGFSELFPYFTVHKIQHLINKLRERGVLLVANYNKIGYDRTNWYSVNDEAMSVYLGTLPVTESAGNPGHKPEHLPAEVLKDKTLPVTDAPFSGNAGAPAPEDPGPPEAGRPPICPNGQHHLGNFPNAFAQMGNWESGGQDHAAENTPEKGSIEGHALETEPPEAPAAGAPGPGGPPICPNGKSHLGNFPNAFAQMGTTMREISQIDPGNFPNPSGKFPAPIPSNKPVYKPAAACEKTETPQSAADPPKAAAAVLQKTLQEIDAALVFTESFYPQAARYLQGHALDAAYPAWLYEQCRGKNPTSLRGLYYSLFFKPDMRALFQETRKTQAPPALTTCPACGARHEARQENCPECGLSRKDRSNESVIAQQRALHILPPEEKQAFITRTFNDFFARHKPSSPPSSSHTTSHEAFRLPCPDFSP
jgi:hypothetical protein